MSSPATSSPAPLSAVNALLQTLSAPMARVDALILDHMQSSVPLIPEIGRHIVSSGGKRVRPLLTLAAAELARPAGAALADSDQENACALAAAVEFIHTATLLHDDVVDGSALRRGAATANEVWGNKSPVLVGDFLFSRAFQLMVSAGMLPVLETLAGASAIIAEGEVHQLKTANDLSTSAQEYEDVIGAKTAALFAAATRVGALAVHAPADQVEALAAYGEQLGLAFQMVDDAMDFMASEKDMGKTAGDDFREGKVTLPIIHAYAKGTDEERAFWQRTIEKLDQREEDLAEACRLFARHGSLSHTLDQARARAAAAKARLADFAPSPLKQYLADLVDFVVERQH